MLIDLIAYTYLRKENMRFFFKVLSISFFVAFIAFIGWFLYSGYEQTQYKAIGIRKFDNISEKYIEITEEELSQYPALEECIRSKERNDWECNVSSDEWTKILNFITEKSKLGNHFFKIKENYYEIYFVTT